MVFHAGSKRLTTYSAKAVCVVSDLCWSDQAQNKEFPITNLERQTTLNPDDYDNPSFIYLWTLYPHHQVSSSGGDG